MAHEHHLMVGTWTRPGAIFTFAFNPEARSLRLVKRTEIDFDEPISWMTFSHDRSTIYGASLKAWTSYSVLNSQTIERTGSCSIFGHERAADADTNTRAIFVLAAMKAPYNVYGNLFYDHAGCGNILSTAATGAINGTIQSYAYKDCSGVHGMVFDHDEETLYSADLRANMLWTHRKRGDGSLELINQQCMSNPTDHPRWVEISASGQYLYLLMEKSNWLAEYRIDSSTKVAKCTGKRFSLLPDASRADLQNFRGDVVFRSHSGRYLFATTRSNTLNIPGYISAYRVNPDGAIQEQLCLQETRSSGGHSNAVSPCPWSDEWLAITDDTVGFIELWSWRQEILAFSVRCEVREPGFGMNAIWYD